MAYKTEVATCAGCGVLFETNRRAKYCSRECYITASSARIVLNCQHCGKPMDIYKSKVKKGGGKYCSMACKGRAMSSNQLSGDYKECVICGSLFYVKASRLDVTIYCSIRCRGLGQRNGEFFNCELCGKRFYRPLSSIREGRFHSCSRKCQLALYEKEGNPNWCGGIDAKQKRRSAEAGLPSTLTEEQWEWLLDYYGHRCAYCGRGERQAGTLAREHVIPVSMGGGYTLKNIVPACTSCNSTKHARTPAQAGLVFWKERHRVEEYA